MFYYSSSVIYYLLPITHRTLYIINYLSSITHYTLFLISITSITFTISTISTINYQPLTTIQHTIYIIPNYITLNYIRLY